jgi:hypothetical protein
LFENSPAAVPHSAAQRTKAATQTPITVRRRSWHQAASLRIGPKIPTRCRSFFRATRTPVRVVAPLSACAAGAVLSSGSGRPVGTPASASRGVEWGCRIRPRRRFGVERWRLVRCGVSWRCGHGATHRVGGHRRGTGVLGGTLVGDATGRSGAGPRRRGPRAVRVWPSATSVATEASSGRWQRSDSPIGSQRTTPAAASAGVGCRGVAAADQGSSTDTSVQPRRASWHHRSLSYALVLPAAMRRARTVQSRDAVASRRT